MKVRALKNNLWKKRDINGKIIGTGEWVRHYENVIYEVVNECLIDESPAYLIKVDDDYGAILKKECEIIEGSENDLIVNSEIDLIL